MTIDETIVEYAAGVVERFGTGKVLERSEIQREVNATYGITPGSIIPSDYCYNRVNNGITLSKPTVFVYKDRSLYECVGPNFAYNGPIFHQPKGGSAFKVGECIDGKRFIAPDGSYEGVGSSEMTQSASNSVPRKTGRTPGMALRFQIMKRDRFTCCTCGASPAKDPAVELHVDHIIPWAKGGETTTDNLQTLCAVCNMGKRDSV
jgi:hypothetical protein